jgi:hypothetical protein
MAVSLWEKMVLLLTCLRSSEEKRMEEMPYPAPQYQPVKEINTRKRPRQDEYNY